MVRAQLSKRPPESDGFGKASHLFVHFVRCLQIWGLGVGLITLCALLAFAPVAFAQSTGASVSQDKAGSMVSADIKRIQGRGRLIVAMYEHDNPPFYQRDPNGRMSGFDVALISGFARRLGVSIDFVRTARTFDEVIDQVARGEADVGICKISRTFPRAMRVAYSRPYLRLRQALLINRLQLAQVAQGRPTEEVIRDFRGKLGVLQGSSYEQFARQRFPRATIVGYPTWDDLVDAVSQGKVLAAYRDEIEIKKIIKAHPEILFMVRTVVLTDTEDPIAIAVNRADQTVLTLLNLHLEDLHLTVSVDDILDGVVPPSLAAFDR